MDGPADVRWIGETIKEYQKKKKKMNWFFNRVMTAAGRSQWNDMVDEIWNAEVIKLIACVFFLTVCGRHLSL
jgi:hypothetical protein